MCYFDNWEHKEGVLSYQYYDCHYPQCSETILNSNYQYSHVYLQIKQVCLEAIYSGSDAVAILPTGCMESQSYFIFFLHCSTTKSTVGTEQQNPIPQKNFSFEYTHSNRCKKHTNVSRQMYSFLEVKLRQSLKKSWTKINYVIQFVKRSNKLCLHANSSNWRAGTKIIIVTIQNANRQHVHRIFQSLSPKSHIQT